MSVLTRNESLFGLLSEAQAHGSLLNIKTVSGDVFVGSIQKVQVEYIVILDNLTEKVILFSALESIVGF